MESFKYGALRLTLHRDESGSFTLHVNSDVWTAEGFSTTALLLRAEPEMLNMMSEWCGTAAEELKKEREAEISARPPSDTKVRNVAVEELLKAMSKSSDSSSRDGD